LTQKCFETFDQQTSIRGEEVQLLELAEEEIAGRAKWDYALGHDFDDEVAPKKRKAIRTGGARIMCFRDENREYSFEFTTDFEGKETAVLEQELIKFVVVLQNKVRTWYPGGLEIRTEHTRHGIKFRAHAKYRGGIWRDWVLVQWNQGDDPLPARIWGYVDLNKLAQNSGVKHGGNDDLDPGVYAIVECATYLDENGANSLSNIFTPIKKKVIQRDGFVSKSVLYLADVETFVAPIAVIPDIGGDKNAYFVIKNQSQWKENFVEWLDEPVRNDVIDSDIDDSDYESEDETPAQTKAKKKAEHQDEMELDYCFDNISEEDLELLSNASADFDAEAYNLAAECASDSEEENNNSEEDEGSSEEEDSDEEEDALDSE
jgi:hypothetical protein